jgi:hypothetical protein
MFMAKRCNAGTGWVAMAAGALSLPAMNAKPNITKGMSASSITINLSNLNAPDRVLSLRVLTIQIPARMLKVNSSKSPKPMPIELKT